MRKNNVKATIYTVLGIAIAIAAVVGIAFLYFSGTVLPVYIAGSYILKNQIKRYVLYATLVIVIIAAVKVADYGAKYLINKKFRKNKRRRWRLLICEKNIWKNYNKKILVQTNNIWYN